MDEQPIDMDTWLGTLAITLGVDPLSDDQVMELLGVARDVAHGVERRATPLATFLLGAAAQRRIGHGATATDAFADALTELRTILPAPS
ncbi:MAG: DUF6457 domain-containing protein [Actinomycetota bacterium]